MLKFEPIRAITEVDSIVSGYRKRLEELHGLEQQLQEERDTLNKRYVEALGKDETGEKVDIKVISNEMKINEEKLAETKNRIGALENALDQGNISSIPKVEELLKAAEKECQEFCSKVDEEVQTLENELVKAKTAYLQILNEIGQLQGLKHRQRKEFSLTFKNVTGHSRYDGSYPQLITFTNQGGTAERKPWFIDEDRIDDAFRKGVRNSCS